MIGFCTRLIANNYRPSASFNVEFTNELDHKQVKALARIALALKAHHCFDDNVGETIHCLLWTITQFELSHYCRSLAAKQIVDLIEAYYQKMSQECTHLDEGNF